MEAIIFTILIRLEMNNVLYLEDDEEVAGLVLEILEFEKFDVVTDSGRAMDKLLKEHNFGLVLIDEGLAWCRGSDLCRKIKQHPETAHLPVLMISAYAEIDVIAELCGADAYIRKPFDMYDVIEMVQLYYREPAS